jgi:plasmid replication initiation protein
MGKPQEKARKEVVKHSAAIQIRNNIPLLQRRTWNILLHHAYNELETHEKHSINVKELLETLKFPSRNDYFKESVKALLGCIVEWNVLDKDGIDVWGAAPLLAGVEIKDGICTYAFSPFLREKLYNPRMYARLDLSLQNQFESKHALALWEVCVDYLGSGREYGESPYISIEHFRKLMGIESAYLDMKKLNARVINPTIAEINRVSDLQVTVDYQRKGRKVEALKFKIRRVAMLPVADYRQPALFPDLEDMPEVVKRLKEAGLAESDAWEFWQKGWEFVSEKKRPGGEADLLDYVREKIDLLKQREKEGKVQNASGFLLTALKQNFSHAEYEKKQAAQQKSDKIKQLRQLLKERERLLEQQDDAVETLCNEVIALPGQADKALVALEMNPDFARWYDKDRSPLENYWKNRPVGALMAEWLEGQFAEQFEAVRQSYRDKLAAIDAQVAAFEEGGISTKYLR